MSTTDAGRTSVPGQHETLDRDAPPRAVSDHTRTDAVRDAIHAGACVLAGVLITLGVLLDPASDVDAAADVVAVAADDTSLFYWSNTIAAFGLAMVAAAGLAVMRLVRGRGRVLATVGGVLTTIGGVSAGAGVFMYGAVLAGMAESDVEPAAQVALQEHLEDSLRPGLAFLLGFVPLMLGLVICGVALYLSRAVPVWLGPLLGLGVVLVMALGDTSISTVGDVVLTISLATVGVCLWRATSGARTG